MALMSEERRKEMEEEMNRFELEIAAPGESKPLLTQNMTIANSKPLSPPPAPPAVSVLIPDVLIKAPPPPPPPPLSPPTAALLRPPPPPPILPSQPPPAPSSIRFIPPQLQRQPPKPPPVRTNFMGMPAPFPPPGPFGPPLNQGPPMGSHPMPPVGPMPPSNQMHSVVGMPPGPPMTHMHGPMPPMPPGVMPMHMPHPMGMNLPMPPGFGPPSGPPMPLPSEMGDQQYFHSNTNTEPQIEEAEIPVSDAPSTNENSTVLAAAPAIYAAPFVKSHSENVSASTSASNGQDAQVVTTMTTVTHFQKSEKNFSTKADDSSVGPTVSSSTTNEENVVSKKKEKKKKIVRMAGGQAWEDNSLLDWDPDDFRIFCGDLGNDVTDEVLIRAFSKYTSFVKAKVIRDKRTNKTKGYGFVSFKDPQDFIKAMREMNGRYVGSRPIKLRKSTWRDRNIELVKKKQREKEKLGLL